MSGFPTEDANILNLILAELRAIRKAMATADNGPSVATDTDLDGQYGDPEIRHDPKRWEGPSMLGRRFSQCPPEYLDTVASFKLWSAGKDDESGAVDSKGRPKSHWARKDAALAAGWAKRLRGGWKSPGGADNGASRYGGTSGYGANAKHTGSPEPSTDFGYDGGNDDIPF